MTAENAFGWVVSIINFAIVFVLFKAIVIDPMKKAVREREENTRKRLEEAEALLQDAIKHKKQYEELLGKTEAEKATIVEHAREEAVRIREGRQREAERDSKFAVEKAQQEADLMRRQAGAELSLLAADRSVTRARRLLEENLDADSKQSILKSFVDRVGKL